MHSPQVLLVTFHLVLDMLDRCVTGMDQMLVETKCIYLSNPEENTIICYSNMDKSCFSQRWFRKKVPEGNQGGWFSCCMGRYHPPSPSDIPWLTSCATQCVSLVYYCSFTTISTHCPCCNFLVSLEYTEDKSPQQKL